MTSCYINFFAETCNIMMKHKTTAIFHHINVHFEGNKIKFKRSNDKQNLTPVVFSYEIY